LIEIKLVFNAALKSKGFGSKQIKLGGVSGTIKGSLKTVKDAQQVFYKTLSRIVPAWIRSLKNNRKYYKNDYSW